jgi:crotonobetainyl-CoA:carnitine CoA-transferase CaiB-like acyl-CoA transferase
MFFAELGAKVIKIENKPAGGDVTRNWRLPGETDKGPSAYFSAINYGKEYLMLDLTNAKDRSQFHEECKDADIVISNYSDRVAAKLGADYTHLKKLNPELIFLSLSGFENSDKPAYDVVLQAETGWISMTGSPESPAKMPVALIDIIAGHQLKEAALLALIKKLKTGKGSYITCSLERAAISALANQASNYLMTGAVAKPLGTRHPNIAPYGDWFETSDHIRFVLAIGNDKQFEALLDVLGLQHELPAFQTNTLRLENRDKLNQILSEKIAGSDFEKLSNAFQKAKVPYGEIKSLDRVLQSPAAQKMIKTEIIEGRETKRVSGNGFLMVD